MGIPAKDITGQRFHKLVAIKQNGRSSCGKVLWLCQCDCGNTTTVQGVLLRNGSTKSCGCLVSEKITKRNTTHGMTCSREYHSWKSMKGRCINKNDPAYRRYGGRGISVCDRWVNSFENFVHDMGSRPKQRTLDRINNEGDYSPENCRWASRKQQNDNRRGTTLIEHGGAVRSCSDWSRRLGGRTNLVADRLASGWSEEKAVTTPLRKKLADKEAYRGNSI